jgi:hypothetical protein
VVEGVVIIIATRCSNSRRHHGLPSSDVGKPTATSSRSVCLSRPVRRQAEKSAFSGESGVTVSQHIKAFQVEKTPVSQQREWSTKETQGRKNASLKIRFQWALHAMQPQAWTLRPSGLGPPHQSEQECTSQRGLSSFSFLVFFSAFSSSIEMLKARICAKASCTSSSVDH